MVTLQLVHILWFIIFAEAAGFYFFHQYTLKKAKALHDKELEEIQEQMKEIEELAKEKIEKTEKGYENAIKTLDDEINFYQKYMIDVSTAINLSDNKLKEIDLSGTFATDDEIGWFFKTVKDIQKILNEFRTEIQDRKF